MRTAPALLSLPALALLGLPAAGQAPTLSRGGGAVPGAVTWSVDGGAALAGETYGIVVGLSEEASMPLPGVMLDVALDNLNWTFTVPGLFAGLDAAGSASAAVPLTDPALVGLTVSAQALAGPDFDAPSNLVRTTLAAKGTFSDTLGSPLLTIVGGAVARDAAGDLVFAGGTGPLAQKYRQQLEEFELAGLAFGAGLLSQATALADGRVLFTGGLDLSGAPTTAAALWDPVSGTTTELAMGTPRAGHAAALTSGGRVLISGGFENVTIDLEAILADPLQLLSLFDGVLGTTEFFDPVTLSFSSGPGLLEPRALHAATTLNSGRVMLSGGLTLIPLIGVPTISATAAIYEPGIGSFGLPSLFDGPRLLHSAIRQQDGSVLLVGGLTVDLAAFIASGSLADLAVGSRDDIVRYTDGLFFGGWETVAQMTTPRAGCGLLSTPSGDVLIAGGLELNLSASLTELELAITETAELYTQGGGTAPTGSMSAPRLLPTMAALDDGTLLVVGGSALGAEVYQP